MKSTTLVKNVFKTWNMILFLEVTIVTVYDYLMIHSYIVFYLKFVICALVNMYIELLMYIENKFAQGNIICKGS
jgi:hypothetical protein